MPDTLRVAIGMTVDEFNSQPAIDRWHTPLDTRTQSAAKIGEPHTLSVEVNGHAIPFEAGGENAFTYVMNGYSLPDSKGDYGRIESLNFDIGRSLTTLPDAVARALDGCKAMRAAALSPVDSSRLGIITETFKSGANRAIANENDLIAAFTDDSIRARAITVCNLKDENHEFHLQIARSPYVSGEKAYRVSGYLAQNTEKLNVPPASKTINQR